MRHGSSASAEGAVQPIQEEQSTSTVTKTEVLLRKEAKLTEHGNPYGGGDDSALDTSNTRKLNTERSHSTASNMQSQPPLYNSNKPSARKETLNLSGTRILLANSTQTGFADASTGHAGPADGGPAA